MKDERLRVQLDSEYASSLGHALFCFARLEWDAAHSCERISPGYLNNLGVKTAGKIADDLIDNIKTRPQVWAKYEKDCREFDELVKLRNRLVHARPGTSSSGEQRLFDKDRVLDIAAVNDAADRFTACQARLNEMLHNHL
jgi:hypothetical protein